MNVLRGLTSGAVIVGIIAGGAFVSSSLTDSEGVTTATGIPLRHAGDSPPCPCCQHAYTRNTSGYSSSYLCRQCERRFGCRLEDDGHMVFEK